LIEGETVTIAVKPDQPQISLQAGAEFDGFEIRLAKYIAQRTTKRDPAFSPVVTNIREQLLESKQVPMVIGTYSDTSERQGKVALAGPYISTPEAVLVRQGYTDIRSFGDLKGKVVCTTEGSTSYPVLNSPHTGVQVITEEYFSNCVAKLKSQQVDAVGTDFLILYGYQVTSEDLTMAVDISGRPVEIPTAAKDRWMVGLQPGDVEDCNKVADALKAFLNDNSWESNFTTWFPGIQQVYPNWTQTFKPDDESVGCVGRLN
jgi:glutamate transport system substrate-binding protein